MFGGLTVLVSFILLSLSFRGTFATNWIEENGKAEVGSGHHDHLPGFEDTPLERSWAMYSPAWPVEEYKKPGHGCQVTQVNFLQRHGARYPTSGSAKTIVSALQKLKTAGSDVHPSLVFLKNYTYGLGVADLLPSGAEELYKSGITTYKRYQELVESNQNSPPFIRASLSERVVYSASNWSAGFSDADKIADVPISVLMPEDASFNSTLDHNNCPAEGDSDEQTQQWTSIFAPPIAARLSPSANLTNDEVYGLMSLCPFETAAIGSTGNGEKGLGYGGRKVSPWCRVFSPKEFEMFEYEGDIDKFFNTGPGSKFGRVQGVGYVNELIARLTSQPVVDNTNTNRTLDASAETFPLNRDLYADFSHDNQMVAIYTALRLLDDYAAPDPSGPQKDITGKRWRTSELVPFAATMVVERLGCQDGTYVRILVNDKVQPLKFCGTESGTGMCEIGKFVESQGYSVRGGDGDFEKCFQV